MKYTKVRHIGVKFFFYEYITIVQAKPRALKLITSHDKFLACRAKIRSRETSKLCADKPRVT